MLKFTNPSNFSVKFRRAGSFYLEVPPLTFTIYTKLLLLADSPGINFLYYTCSFCKICIRQSMFVLLCRLCKWIPDIKQVCSGDFQVSMASCFESKSCLTRKILPLFSLPTHFRLKTVEFIDTEFVSTNSLC